jgi:hypothetical protein
MTKATEADKRAIAEARRYLRAAKIRFYDPETMEPEGKTIAQLQEWDLRQMKKCSALLVVWTDNTPDSRGVNAEIEWARRLFNIPIYVWIVPGTRYTRYPEPWPRATFGGSVRMMEAGLCWLIKQLKFEDKVKRNPRWKETA